MSDPDTVRFCRIFDQFDTGMVDGYNPAFEAELGGAEGLATLGHCQTRLRCTGNPWRATRPGVTAVGGVRAGAHRSRRRRNLSRSILDSSLRGRTPLATG
jgi:hypothetical protein